MRFGIECMSAVMSHEKPTKRASRGKRKSRGALKMKRRCESWYEPVFSKEEWVGVITFHCRWSSAVTMVFLRASTNTRLGFTVNHKCVFFSLDSAPVFTDKVSEEKGPCQDSALNHIIQRERSRQDSLWHLATDIILVILHITKLYWPLSAICLD